MTTIETQFVLWAVTVLGAACLAIIVWNAKKVWITAMEILPAAMSNLKKEVQDSLDDFATKQTVIEMDRRLDRRLDTADTQRLEFHKENIQHLEKISKTIELVHGQAVDLGRLDARLASVEVRQKEMIDWKHLVVDPYVPGEMINLNRRLTNLERK